MTEPLTVEQIDFEIASLTKQKEKLLEPKLPPLFPGGIGYREIECFLQAKEAPDSYYGFYALEVLFGQGVHSFFTTKASGFERQHRVRVTIEDLGEVTNVKGEEV